MYVACLFPYRGVCSSVGFPRHLVVLYNTTSWRRSGQSGKKCLLLGTFSWAAQSLHIATSSALHRDTRPLRANAFHTPRSQLLLCYPHQPWRLLGFAVEHFSLKTEMSKSSCALDTSFSYPNPGQRSFSQPMFVGTCRLGDDVKCWLQLAGRCVKETGSPPHI